MVSINKIGFNGSETTGSVAKNTARVATCPPEQLACDTVSFRGKETEEANKKKNKGLKAVLYILGAAALSVGGLGLLHKHGGAKLTEMINKAEGKWYKKPLEWTETASKKCHEWCSVIKKNTWDKLFKKAEDKADDAANAAAEGAQNAAGKAEEVAAEATEAANKA